MTGLNGRMLSSIEKRLFTCIACLPLFIECQYFLPTIFWDPNSPALHRLHWDKVVNVKIFQTLTFVCPNKDVSIVPFQTSNTKSYYNLYARELAANDTHLNYETVCDPKESLYKFFCDQPRTTVLNFSSRRGYSQFAINTGQADPTHPKFRHGMDYIFFSTSNGTRASLRTSSTKCTMVFRIHFCAKHERCPLPRCSTYGREDVCVPKSMLSDAPRFVRITANTTSSLTVSWEKPLNEDYEIAYYSVCYRANISRDCQTKMVEAHVSSTILENLNSSTEYLIRVRAHFCKGPGNYSVEIRHTTREVAPATTELPQTTAKPTTLMMQEKRVMSEPKAVTPVKITCSSIAVAWQPPDVVVDNLTYYSLCCRTRNNSLLTGNCEKKTFVGPESTSAVVYSLEANTSYEIRIQAHNCNGAGNYSRPLTVKTAVPDKVASSEAHSSCDDPRIDAVSLVIGIIIGVIAALAAVVFLYMATAKWRRAQGKPPVLRNVSNRGYLSSVSGINTIDKKNDKNLNCTMELTSTDEVMVD